MTRMCVVKHALLDRAIGSVVNCGYRDDAAPTRPALTRHRRLAAYLSYDFAFDVLGFLFAKYVPVIPSTAGEDAR